MHKGVIYKITHRETGRVYVGKTRNFKKRIRGHKYAAKNKGTKNEGQPIIRAIREYGEDAFDYEIIYASQEFAGLEEYNKHMNIMEQRYIKMYDSIRNGFNLTKGGSGMLGYTLPKESRNLIGKANKGRTISESHKDAIRQAALKNWSKPEFREKMSKTFSGEGNPMFGVHIVGEKNHMFGKRLSDETKQKIALAKKGKKGTPMSTEHKEKLRLLMAGKPKSEELKRKISDSLTGRKNPSKWRPILQYTLEGGFVKEWSSISEAQETYNTKHISACANGKRNNAAGYYWQYKDGDNIPLTVTPSRHKGERRIAQIDENGNIIRTFNSIREASRKLGLKYSNISNVLQKLQKKTGNNYRFTYLE